MRLLRNKLFFVVAIAAVVLAACEGDAEEEGAEAPLSIRYGTAFPQDISEFGVYISEEMGYFEEENLEVELLVFDGAAATIQQVAAGRADVGRGGGPTALYEAGAQGIDVIAFYQVDQENIFSINTLSDTEIDSIEDLRGETLGVSEFTGGEISVTRAALAEAGLEEGEDVELVAVGSEAPAVSQALESGRIAAYAGADSTLLGMQALGFEPVNILPEKYRALGGGMYTTAGNLEEKREALVRFARAYAKGSLFARTNPEAALEIGCEVSPEDCTDMELAMIAMNYYTDLQRPREGDDIGSLREIGWEAAAEILEQTSEEFEGETIDWMSFIDSSLLDEINDFDRAEVEADAEAR